METLSNKLYNSVNEKIKQINKNTYKSNNFKIRKTMKLGNIALSNSFSCI